MAGHRLGFLQDNLYHIGKKPKQSSDFHDLTVGNNTCFGCAVDSGGNPVDVPGFNAVPRELGSHDGGLGSAQMWRSYLRISSTRTLATVARTSKPAL